MSTPRKITLQSGDNQKFEVDENVAAMSHTIKFLIDDDCADNVIPLPNVKSEILTMILEYCKKHVEAAAGEDGKDKKKNPSSDDDDDALETWDAEFVRVDQNTLRELLLAANYLNIKSLLDLTTQTVSGIIRGRTVEQVREYFNIKNDWTPEEEAAARKQVEWAGL